MNIYLIRHGQTKSNRSRKVIGRCLDPNLNKQGRLDALRAYENLSNAYPPYDIIYSSTMKRASQTARIIKKNTKYPVKIIYDPNFVERNFANLESKVVDEAYELMKSLDFDTTNYETDELLISRVIENIKKLEKCNYKNVLIVTHSHVIKAVYKYLDPASDIFFQNIISNGSVHKFKLENDLITKEV